jgi:OMF family outer membrane factor
MLSFLILLFFANTGFSQDIWTLQECLDSARQHNKKLLISERNIDAAAKNVSASKARLIPKLSINAEYKYFTDLPYQLMPMSVFGGPEGQFKEAQFGVPHNISGNLFLSVPLYNAQIYGGIEAAEQGVELRQLVHEKTLEEVLFEVSVVYYNAQIIVNRLMMIDSNIVNVERVLRNTEALGKHQLVMQSEISKVKLKLSQLKTQKDQVTSQYQQVTNSLKFMMGIELDRKIKITKEIQNKPTASNIEKQTLDVSIAQTKASIAETELKLVKGSRLPSVSLFGSYGTTGFGYDQEPNRFLNFYPLGFGGVKLTYPLFNGTVTERIIDQKSIAVENARTSLALEQDRSNLELINAQLRWSNAKKNMSLTNEQMLFAKEILGQTLEEYKNELAGLTEVLLAENELQQAQQNYLTSIVEFLKADLALRKYSGNFELN